MKKYDTLYINAKLVPFIDNNAEIDFTQNLAIGQKNGIILFIGSLNELNGEFEKLAGKIIDLKGKLVTPGLIDCHTHIIFGGNRANELRMRLEGESYEQISRQGGGINSTVEATRNSSQDDLYKQAKRRILELMQDGVTTVEIKSGYGLNIETERKMLQVAHRIEKTLPVNISKTFLGAHTIPNEYANNRTGYIDLLCEEMIPQLHREGLIDAVDAFCENIAFTVEEVERVFSCAQGFQLPVKIHAEQLSNSNGSKLAAKYKALSADHIEYLDEAGVKAMADSGTVAVLLPGAFYMLKETKLPPIELLRKYNVPIAIATDCNPGSSPTLSLRLMMNMACQLFGMSPEETLRAVTINAAKALGREHDLGSLAVGKIADMVVWSVTEPEELSYWLGGRLVDIIIKNGEVVSYE